MSANYNDWNRRKLRISPLMHPEGPTIHFRHHEVEHDEV
jgi:hypothetical protein